MYIKHKGIIWVLCNPDLYITTIGLFTLLSSNYSQTKSVSLFIYFFKNFFFNTHTGTPILLLYSFQLYETSSP